MRIRLSVAVIALVLLGGFGLLFWNSLSGRTPHGAAQAQESPAPVQEGDVWAKRCQDFEEGKQHCEIFQRLVVQETGMLVADFAIGFPEDARQTARGVVVLPLGMLLAQDNRPSMQIDEGSAFSFSPRFCAPSGCYSYLTLTDQVIDSMRKGDVITFAYRDVSGRTVNIKMSLKGFTKALREIKAD